jgi:hypothetical protein
MRSVRARSAMVLFASGGLALVLLAVVCSTAVFGDGAAQGAMGRSSSVSAIRLTRRIPPHVRKICAVTQRHVRIHVVCPPLVPAGGVVTDPGLSYSNTYRRVTDFYSMTFNNGEIRDKLHWIVGAGTAARVDRYVLSSRYWNVKGPVQRLGNVHQAGRDIALYSFPEEPAGGLFGSHVVAVTRVGGLVLFASVHGYGQGARQADIAMLIAMADLRAKENRRSR